MLPIVVVPTVVRGCQCDVPTVAVHNRVSDGERTAGDQRDIVSSTVIVCCVDNGRAREGVHGSDNECTTIVDGDVARLRGRCNCECSARRGIQRIRVSTNPCLSPQRSGRSREIGRRDIPVSNRACDGIDLNSGRRDEATQRNVDGGIDIDQAAASLDDRTVGHEYVGGAPRVVGINCDGAAG